MAAKEAAATEARDSGGSGGSSNKLILILSAVNTVVVIAMMAILFISFQKEKKAASVADISTQEEPAAEAKDAHGGGEHGGGHGGGEHGGKEAAKKSNQFGKIVTLDMFTVNLTTPGGSAPRFVRVNISMEVPNDEVEAEVTHKMAQVRNTVIDLFNSKRPTDLATTEGREYIKEEIKTAINGFLVSGKIKGVFFTNFAVTS